MPFFSRIVFFTVYFSFFFFEIFIIPFFIDGAGRHASALGNETVHGRTLLESFVHMF